MLDEQLRVTGETRTHRRGAIAEAAARRRQRALALPNIHGLVVGRSLLYAPDDDVAAAVDTAVSLP